MTSTLSEANLKHIAAFSVREYPAPMDPTSVTIAYGDRGIPKLVRLLADPVLVVRQRALKSLNEQIHRGPRAIESLDDDVIPALIKTLKDEDRLVRERSAEALGTLSLTMRGKEKMIEQKGVEALADAIREASVPVRETAYRAFVNQTQHRIGTLGVLQAKCLPIFVERVLLEVGSIQPLVLQVLRNCVTEDEGLFEALEKRDGVSAMVKLLEHESSTVRAGACVNLALLCFPVAGKEHALACKAVASLCRLLSDPDAKVQAEAASALMSITIANEGKAAVFEANAIAALIRLLKSTDELVVLNGIKLIANVAEELRARKQLQAYETSEQLEQLTKHSQEMIARHATACLKVVTWTP
eukprot:TRINITY_DN8292_c0_g1_i1.p1 TRINITY_DN8292_c0_g1~~TRINITY_DN8292_c0_g1_i1.p1  ORF type:complete len:365 (+),score=83.10 TRINITY_DN8292_c0_g1_i1:27-1097(+)